VPNLLFLTQRLPYPPIKGEKIRQWQILNYLARWYDVHLGCLIDDPADAPHAGTVRALCRSMCAPPLNRRIAKMTCARGLFTGEALSVAFFQNSDLRKWVENLVTEIQPELTFVISSNMAPYVLDLPRTGKRIVDLVDVDSEKFLAYSETASFPMRQIYRREWQRVAALERRIALECDASILVSDAEAELFARQMPKRARTIHGISNGVDHRYFDPAGNYSAVYALSVPTFVFTGTMDYLPNIDAVTWFATTILPAIQQVQPMARFFIVGSNPAESVRRLGSLAGVTVTGSVPDVRPYIFHATACVAPLRVARGIQNKVLEAMAMGKPVIVTHGALEGISATPGREVVLATDAENFASAALHLTGTNGDTTLEGASIGRAARQLILERYDWQTCLAALEPLVRPKIDSGSDIRAVPEFTGAAS